MCKATVRWMIRRNVDALNDGRYRPALSMFAPDAQLAFPGVNSWSDQFRTPRTGREPFASHRGRDQIEAFLVRYVGQRIQMKVEDILVNGPPWNTRTAVRAQVWAIGPDGEDAYNNRAVLMINARWGKIRPHTPVRADAVCDAMEPMWLQAQAVPTADLIPCVASLPVGWSFGLLTADNGRSTITVDHDRAGSKTIDLRFTDSCDATGATEVASDLTGARRFERRSDDGSRTVLTWYEVSPGGCTSVRLSSRSTAARVLEEITAEAGQIIGFVSRAELAKALDERSGGRLQLDPAS